MLPQCSFLQNSDVFREQCIVCLAHRTVQWCILLARLISSCHPHGKLATLTHTGQQYWDWDWGHRDQIRARVSLRLFLKSIFPKNFRNCLFSSVGSRKSELTYFDPPLIKLRSKVWNFMNADFDSSKKASWGTERN